MSDIKFSQLTVANNITASDFIAIVRSGSASGPNGSPPNNYIVQAQYFTASWSQNSISSSVAKTASYFNISGLTDLILQGNLEVVGTATINKATGSLFGTSSWSNKSLTASFVDSNAISGTVTSASYAVSSSYALSSSNSLSSSYALSSSNSLSSSYALSSSNSLSSSYAVSSSYALSSSNSLSSSYALTSSFTPSSSYSNYSSQSLRSSFIDSEYNNQAVMFSTCSNLNGGMYGEYGYTYFVTRNQKIGLIGFPRPDYPYHFLYKNFNGYSNMVALADGISVDVVGDYASSQKLDSSIRSIKKIINNLYSTYLLFDDGTLLGRGLNSYGELGQGHNTPSWQKINRGYGTWGSAPWFQISGKGSLSGKTVIDIDVCAGANGVLEENLFILTQTSSGNNLHACGYQGSYGQFGVGNITNYNTPTQILSNDLTASKIYNGGQTWYWISTTGNLYGAGLNHYGTLAQGNQTNSNTWVQAKVDSSTHLTNVRSVHAGHNAGNSYQTFAIKNDNTVWGVGLNSSGRLGLNDTTDRYYFTQLTGSDNNFSASNITTITYNTGDYNTYIALLTGSGQTGSIKSWGYNPGLIGDGGSTDRNVPTSPNGGSASEIAGKIVKVIPKFHYSSGMNDVVILTDEGKLYSTGNGSSRLTRGLNKEVLSQNEETTYRKVDLSQLEAGDTIIDVTSGNAYNDYWAYYALTNKGNVLSWGAYYANGRQQYFQLFLPEYIYKDGKFILF